jgi:hypothetical protein
MSILSYLFKDPVGEYYNRKNQYRREQYLSVAFKYGGRIPNTAWTIDREPTIRDANELGHVLMFTTQLGPRVVSYDIVDGRPWHPLS